MEDPAVAELAEYGYPPVAAAAALEQAGGHVLRALALLHARLAAAVQSPLMNAQTKSASRMRRADRASWQQGPSRMPWGPGGSASSARRRAARGLGCEAGDDDDEARAATARRMNRTIGRAAVLVKPCACPDRGPDLHGAAPAVRMVLVLWARAWRFVFRKGSSSIAGVVISQEQKWSER